MHAHPIRSRFQLCRIYDLILSHFKVSYICSLKHNLILELFETTLNRVVTLTQLNVNYICSPYILVMLCTLSLRMDTFNNYNITCWLREKVINPFCLLLHAVEEDIQHVRIIYLYWTFPQVKSLWDYLETAYTEKLRSWYLQFSTAQEVCISKSALSKYLKMHCLPWIRGN